MMVRMTGDDGLYFIGEDDALTAMTVTPYEAEEVLQTLLAKYPDLLAGAQMDPHDPRRWLLVAREHGVPDRADASGNRWSVDHLFVDQDAIPTLVEVKRSSDTRIRREVVGQMLDYAANGVLYWPVDRLRESFTRTQSKIFEIDPDTAVRDLLGDPESTVESFFDQVFENLRAGRVRLVFVADIIPDELQRIVEFLNTQMSPTQVFAVEVKQYAAAGFRGRAIVPRVIGRTATTMTKSSSGPKLRPAHFRESALPATRELGDRLAAWARELGLTVRETQQARQIRRSDNSVLANMYYSNDTLDIDLTLVAERLGHPHSDSVQRRLQALTTKPLTTKWPSVPTADLLEHWPTTITILDDLDPNPPVDSRT